MSDMTPILLLGAGRMGGALISGWSQAGAFAPGDLIAVEPPPSAEPPTPRARPPRPPRDPLPPVAPRASAVRPSPPESERPRAKGVAARGFEVTGRMRLDGD